MRSALILSSGGLAAPPLRRDLVAVGLSVCGEADCQNLVQQAIKSSPDIIVCFYESPEPAFYASIAAAMQSAPCPIVVFTMDPSVEKIALAINGGAHLYAVAGYSPDRLRSQLQVAETRFHQIRALTQQLEELRVRFEERKLVDRAKGILMGARQLREEEAFRALRSAAMAAKSRIGQVSQVVIDSASYAEAVNRAGQLRMLSQRLAKLYVLECMGLSDAISRQASDDAMSLVTLNLSVLDRALPKSTFEDLVTGVSDPWSRLKDALGKGADVRRLSDVDGLADQVRQAAELLTANLEIAAFSTVLHPINVAGRQRMLIQKLAKEILLDMFREASQARIRLEDSETFKEIVTGLDYLERMPLTNDAIRLELVSTNEHWRSFQQEVAGRGATVQGRLISDASDTLLESFEQLTALIERGVHAMIGV